MHGDLSLSRCLCNWTNAVRGEAMSLISIKINDRTVPAAVGRRAKAVDAGRWRCAMALAAVLVSSSLEVWAGTSGVNVTVTPIASPIWLSPSQCSSNCLYGAFKFSAQNGTKNISNLWLKASADELTSSVATGTANIVQGADLPSFCIATANTAVCNVGALAPGAIKEFVLVVVSPSKGDQIRMNWQLTTGQGNTTQSPLSSQTALDSSVTTPGAGFIGLSAYSGLLASSEFKRSASYVPSNGTTFSSSGTSVPTANNIGLVTATVKKPGSDPTAVLVANLFAAASPGVCTTSNYPVCMTFGLQSPGTYGPALSNLLFVSYVRHWSTIQGGNIKNAVLNYTPGSFVVDQQTGAVSFQPKPGSQGTPFQLLDCSVLPGGIPSSDANAPENQKRCIANRTVLGDGSQQIDALLSENGSVSW
jgi:hypothetical protein